MRGIAAMVWARAAESGVEAWGGHGVTSGLGVAIMLRAQGGLGVSSGRRSGMGRRGAERARVFARRVRRVRWLRRVRSAERVWGAFVQVDWSGGANPPGWVGWSTGSDGSAGSAGATRSGGAVWPGFRSAGFAPAGFTRPAEAGCSRLGLPPRTRADRPAWLAWRRCSRYISMPTSGAATARSGTTTLMQYSENTIAKNTTTTMNTTLATLLGSLPMSFSKPG